MDRKNKKDLVFGVRPIIEAIQSGKAINKVLISSRSKTDGWMELMELIKQNEIPTQNVPVEKLKKITKQNHQGVIAFVSPINYCELDQVIPTIFENGETPLILLLDRITDVRNFGAIARSAICMNVDAIIIAKKNAAQITSDAIKASAGSLFNIPVCRVENLVDTLFYLKDSGFQIVSCTEKTDSLISEIDYTLPTTVILGSEETGIQNALLNNSDKKGKIEISSKLNSLNVSVAAGIILYEISKSR